MRSEALGKLEVFVGEWTRKASIGGDLTGTTTFEWTLDGAFLVERSSVPDPYLPDSMSIISVDGEAYNQHYFDSRGVTRAYRMTLEGSTWTLLRDKPDFTPLNFSQRFVATISDDGDTITGAWEAMGDDGTWEKDFDLVYRRVR